MTHVAVIDIGKTNAKLALVRLDGLSEVAVVTRPNTVLPGPPYPHFDVEALWAFVLDGLTQFQASHAISSITVTTHGASGALIDADGALAAPILDYEHTGPDDLAAEYDALRPAFADSGSPRLPGGLNLGAQFHWQLTTQPDLKDRLHRVVTYPQFWAHRLTGVFATDVTSLGAHTDLWTPHEGCLSSLPKALGIADKIAQPRRPADVLGPILPDIARRTGLPQNTPVSCGIHDSNASLVPHLAAREAPFSVVSTGTWVIAMAVGGAPVTLDPARDTLVNVNAYGQPVPSARFMGGREHDIALPGPRPEPSAADITDVLTAHTMLLPALVPETGPFAGRTARWIGAEPEAGSPQRSAAVGFYLALVTARCLDLIGHQGPVIVEGPFAQNRPYLWMLGAATRAPIHPMGSATGTSQGAALLIAGAKRPQAKATAHPPPDVSLAAALSAYAAAWSAAAAR